MAASKIPQVTNNSGDNFVKTPDGVMILWGTFTQDVSASSMVSKTIIFGTAFKSAPTVMCSLVGFYQAVGTHRLSTIPLSRNTSQAVFRLINDASSDYTEVPINWIAIGRWK